MKRRLTIAFVLAGAAFGCNASKTQRAPSLAATPTKPSAPQRNVFKDAGDTTWQVVTSPARLVAPKKADPQKPEVYEAPSAVIVRRGYLDDDVVAPASAPATGPAGK